MPRIMPRTMATLLGALTFAGTCLVLPAQADAADTCGTVRPTVRNSAGQIGGEVQATVCLRSGSGGTEYLNDNYNNYVLDHQADGVAARVYFGADGINYGPWGVDDTSTSGPTYISGWESQGTNNPSVRVWVCLGTASPGASGARCSSSTVSG
ncbi:hypothetical protein GA0115259_105657 [Streptomyces sp. MnatMP-M17]|nr:hypothetical protein GA0115259_105657 [Streptomyces sp. MnatMP-M17]